MGRKGRNMQLSEWSYKPNIVQIETVQGCNRRCKFCGTMGIERAFHYVELKTVQHICKLIKAVGLNCRILLAGHGEPTLHQQLPQIIRIIREILPKNMIHLFTNGTVIAKHPEMVIDLFGAGLNDLVFDEYSDSRIGEFVKNNQICRSFPIFEQGSGVPLFADKKICQRRICITPPIDMDGNTASRKLNNHCGAGMKMIKKPLKAKCSILFRDFYVRWDGNIAICCNDFRGEYYVTNILNCKTLQEAYFHERLESARKFVMVNDRSPIYPCSICNAKPIRPGLLPDARGQIKLPKPSARDYAVVKANIKPLAKIVKREWEAVHD